MKKNENNTKSSLDNALLKKALGFTYTEVSEEYNFVDNELVLTKKKINNKQNPPDLSALQLLLEQNKNINKNQFSQMSDNELKQEKMRLIKLLNKEE